jgi:hypothetical protein
MTGVKYDQDKPRWSLLPMDLIEATVKVLTDGAKKYADNNWKYVRPFRERYYDALMRHIMAWNQGEEFDPESGLPHLAHAMCCMVFLHEGPDEDADNFDGLRPDFPDGTYKYEPGVIGRAGTIGGINCENNS